MFRWLLRKARPVCPWSVSQYPGDLIRRNLRHGIQIFREDKSRSPTLLAMARRTSEMVSGARNPCEKRKRLNKDTNH
uniref:Uncharacterized protein n=1 Tax=Timema bartmani TaxID=61472 RepID=A0A7R9F6D7_9NEOP|nr:unnamed protein product [Timema bartmani]